MLHKFCENSSKIPEFRFFFLAIQNRVSVRFTYLKALLQLNLYCDWLIWLAPASEEKNSSDQSYFPKISDSKSHFWFIVGRGARLSQLVSISKPIMISSFNSMPNQISLQNSNEIRWKKIQKRTFVFMSSTRYSFTKKWNSNFLVKA